MGKLVGQFVKELRESRSLSQGDVAKLLGLKTAQSISNIERGVSPLPRGKIKRLSSILGIQKSEIVTKVMQEMQDRVSRAAGVQLKSNQTAAEILTNKEKELLEELARRISNSKNSERNSILKRMQRLLQ